MEYLDSEDINVGSQLLTINIYGSCYCLPSFSTTKSWRWYTGERCVLRLSCASSILDGAVISLQNSYLPTLTSIVTQLSASEWGVLFDLTDVFAEVLQFSNYIDVGTFEVIGTLAGASVTFDIEGIGNVYKLKPVQTLMSVLPLPTSCGGRIILLPSVAYIMSEYTSPYLILYTFYQSSSSSYINSDVWRAYTAYDYYTLGFYDPMQGKYTNARIVMRNVSKGTESSWVCVDVPQVYGMLSFVNSYRFCMRLARIEYSQKPTEFVSSVGVQSASNTGGDETWTLEIPDLNCYDYAYYTFMLMHAAHIKAYVPKMAQEVELTLASNNKWELSSRHVAQARTLSVKYIRKTSTMYPL